MKRYFYLFLIVLAALLLFSCSKSSTSPKDKAVAKPEFSPPGGIFDTAISVLIHCPTYDALVRYTTDGSDPNDDSELVSGLIQMNTDTTLKAKAFKSGFISSSVVSASYDFSAASVQAVSISPAGGLFYNSIYVTLACPSPDAEIHYTLDGSNPNQNSPLYSAPMLISQSSQLKAKAFVEGLIPSLVSTALFNLQVRDPVFSLEGGNYTTPQTLSISSPNPEAQIRYTLDGSEPNDSSLLYSNPLNIKGNTVIKARASIDNWLPSQVISATFNLRVLDPVFSLESGDYTAAQTLKINCPNPAAQIRYTLDGSAPDENSLLYSKALDINGNTTIKAQAYIDDWTPSQMISATFNLQVLDPVFSLKSGNYATAQTVSISSPNPAAKIHYTLDGSEPDESSAVYSNSLNVAVSTVIKAQAYIENWTPSKMISAFYIIHLSDQMQFVPGGSFNNGTANVSISPFFIGKREVTELEWVYVMQDTLTIVPELPETEMAWITSIAYCNGRSIAEGYEPCYSYGSYGSNPARWPKTWARNHSQISCNFKASGYRLPTEMEWMYAARGGNLSQDHVYSGSNQIDAVAWYVNNSGDSPAPVGTKQANELGLYDMSGNVWEFCWDYYHHEYPDNDSVNPTGPATGTMRVMRGGSFSNDASNCTIARRFYTPADLTADSHGLRVVRKY